MRIESPPGSIKRAYVSYGLSKAFGGIKPDSVKHYRLAAVREFLEADTIVVERIARLYNSLASAAERPAEKYEHALAGIDVLLKYQNQCDYSANLPVELHTFAADAALDQDDVTTALRLAKVGLSYRKKQTQEYVILNMYSVLGSIYLEATVYNKANEMLDSAENQLVLSESTAYKDALDLMNAYDVRQDLHRHNEREFLALRNAKTALEIRTQYAPDSRELAHSLNNYGRILLYDGKYEYGEEHLRRALKLYTENKAYTDRGTVYESLALGEQLKGDTLTAIRYLDSAALAYHGNPSRPGLENAIDQSELRDPLFTKARLLARYHLTHPEQAPLAVVETAVARVDSINMLLRHRVRTERSKRTIIRQTRKLHEELITLFLRQYERTGDPAYLENALFSLESAKARILGERRARLRARSADDVAATQETELRRKIARLREQERNEVVPTKRRSLTTTRQQAERDLDALEDERYAKNAFITESVTTTSVLPELSTAVDTGTAILNYFIGERSVFVAVAVDGEVTIKRFSLPPKALADRIERYRTALLAPGDKRWNGDPAWHDEQLELLAREGHSLYLDLIDKAFPNRSIPGDLVIIPDGVLHTLPFAALLTTPSNSKKPKDWRFLHQHHRLNHQFSARFWHDQKQSKPIRASRTLVVAPIQPDNVRLPSLMGDSIKLSRLGKVDEEIAAVEAHQRRIPEVWKADQASQLARNKDLSDYGILHFAGHGYAYPRASESSFLVLNHAAKEPADRFLTVTDLASRPLPIELLVLSACQTHAGEVAQSEGVISLARAGALSGARSVVSSLWPVPQNVKPEFFNAFYQNLASGQPRFEALRVAQQTIAKRKSRNAHPYYWAGFINLGEGGPLPEQFIP